MTTETMRAGFSLWGFGFFGILCLALSPCFTAQASGTTNRFYRETFDYGKKYVVQVYYDHFNELDPSEQLGAYYLMRAAIVSRDLPFLMYHPRSVEVRDFLEDFYLSYRSARDHSPDTLLCLENYLKSFYTWHGPYEWPGAVKHFANCKWEDFTKALRMLEPKGKGSLHAKLAKNGLGKVVEGLAFDPKYDPYIRGPKGEIGMNVFYDPGLTREEILAYREKKYPHRYMPANTYLRKAKDGSIEELFTRTGGRNLPVPKEMPEKAAFDGLQSQITPIEQEINKRNEAIAKTEQTGGKPSKADLQKKAELEKQNEQLAKQRDQIYFNWVSRLLDEYLAGKETLVTRQNIKPGRYADIMSRAVEELKKARDVAKDPLKRACLEFQIRYFQSGDLVWSMAYWLAYNKSKAPVLPVTGFEDAYADPLGVEAAWEGGVFMKIADPRVQAVSRPEVVAELQKTMPWDRKYDNPDAKANAALIDLFLSFGGLCPACWSGFNNNEDHLGKFTESFSAIVVNWTNARMLGTPPGVAAEFYRNDDPITPYVLEHAAELRSVSTIGHEALGHGMGKRFPNANERLEGLGQMLEEARAEVSSLYLMFNPLYREKVGFDDHKTKAYLQFFATSTLMNYTRVPPKETALQRPHELADNLILNYLLNHDGGISAVNGEGRPWKSGEKLYMNVTDLKKAKKRIGEIVAKTMRIQGDPDLSLAKEMNEKYAVPIRPDWLEQVRARAKEAGYVPQWVGLFPHLEKKKDGTIEVVTPKDFLTQQLHFAGKVDLQGRQAKKH